MSSSTIGTTKFFKGHSLLLPGKAERYNEKPSIVAPKLTSSASALSSRLRAFLPELAAANEALAKRILDEGPKAVDMNINVVTCNNAEDDDEEDEDDEIDDDDVNEKDREGRTVDSSLPEMPVGPQIEMNISIHELLAGSVLDNDDYGDDDNNVDGCDKDEIEEEKELIQSAAKRRVLIEEIDSTVADSRRRRRTRDEDSAVFEEASVKAKRICQEMT